MIANTLALLLMFNVFFLAVGSQCFAAIDIEIGSSEIDPSNATDSETPASGDSNESEDEGDKDSEKSDCEKDFLLNTLLPSSHTVCSSFNAVRLAPFQSPFLEKYPRPPRF